MRAPSAKLSAVSGWPQSTCERESGTQSSCPQDASPPRVAGTTAAEGDTDSGRKTESGGGDVQLLRRSR